MNTCLFYDFLSISDDWYWFFDHYKTGFLLIEITEIIGNQEIIFFPLDKFSSNFFQNDVSLGSVKNQSLKDTSDCYK
jgi:hypothetical protein